MPVGWWFVSLQNMPSNRISLYLNSNNYLDYKQLSFNY